jgi:glucokinase
MTEQEAVVCMDVGGTEIKAAPVGAGGRLLAPVQHFPADAGRPADALLAHFAAIALAAADLARGRTVRGVHLAFPGPFDYENGVSRMRNLDKYDALYGVNLRESLQRRLAPLGLPGESIRFINDVSAYALGEMRIGRAAGAQRAMFICIGTGCGSAFGIGGRLAEDTAPGVPPDGYVYAFPFLDGCIDDYISKRGLLRLTAERLGEPLDGLALAMRAQRGDAAAAGCFRLFGERLRDALLPFLRDFRPDCLCLGGQITRSAALFLAPLQDACGALGTRLHVAADTSQTALQGLSVLGTP